jgi:hypothetical protein
MTQRFYALSLDQFAQLLHRFRFSRHIDAVHMHHTWRPNHAQYRGEASIEAMWRYHTQEKGWSDIAQHLSIAPDGTIWTGRDWNAPPASARGYNGTRVSGPFMFEMIGDFDQGCDRLEGHQRVAVIGVIASVQNKFGLPIESLRFHRAMTDKTCPGSGVDYQEMLAEVQEARAQLAVHVDARAVNWAGPESSPVDERLEDILYAWSRNVMRREDATDGEPEESEMTPEQIRLITGQEGMTVPVPGARAVRGGGDGQDLTPELLDALRPHVINLNQGTFSPEGIFRTTREDVDAMFEDHLERALSVAKANARPLHVLFWAHGGLISERDGLWIAHLQVEWWKRNHIYPVHFVWETGFFDALKQILSGTRDMARAAGARDVWDHTTDPVVEALSRGLGGVKIWMAMKESARLASAEAGGAAYTAAKLAAFCRKHPGEVELHAVGHSAGSIFHSWFLPKAWEQGAPPFTSLHLLAPAIRMDAVKDRLLPRVGDQVKHVTLFTMKRDWEEDDSVAGIYQKSLLYLIYHALEPERQTPILGLEISLRHDPETADLLGLRGRPSSEAEVVWSVSRSTSGRRASTSRTHGGFDNDRSTMNSVARRVLNRDDIIDFPQEAVERSLRGIWDKPAAIPPEYQHWFLPPAPQPPPVTILPPPVALPEASNGALPGFGIQGQRRALCIGIDDYPTMPLGGCVADARAWGAVLETLGFSVSYLMNEQATHNAILERLHQLIAASVPGDVAVFQFAGHGTELEDIDGDEVDGTNGPKDEALCPYDISQGAFVIDDDIAEVFTGIREGVNVTCFIDCCHSGTITRFMVGAASNDDQSRRARFLPASPAMQAAHRAFRERLGRRRTLDKGTPDQMRQVVFAACLDREVAYESGGQGEFTLRAVQILRQGIGGLTNEAFQHRVRAAFGSQPRQHPDLDCAEPMRQGPLLQPLRAAHGPAQSPVATDPAALVQALRATANLLAGR